MSLILSGCGGNNDVAPLYALTSARVEQVGDIDSRARKIIDIKAQHTYKN